ncbi:MAG: FtsX-like permease family protein [Gammaproteobacteria bacterium]|nr:FtsX-like permease family protein [Gammaproteobacteria bacterium]
MSILDRKLRRDLRARRSQFIAVIVTIVLGIALFGGSYDAYLNLTASYDQMFVTLNTADMTISGGDTEAIVAAAREVDGVEDVSTRSVAEVPVRIDGHHKMLGRLVGLPGDAQPSIDQVTLLSGTYLSGTDSVLLEQHMATHFKLKPGSVIEVLGPQGWVNARVAGVAASAEYLWPAPSRQQIFPSFDDFGILFVDQDVFAGIPSAMVRREVLVTYVSGADTATVDQALKDVALAHGAADATPLADLPSNAALSEDLSGFQEMSLMFPLLFLAAAGMATYVLLTRLVLSQRGQIGLLVANGFHKRTIFGHYLRFGLLAGAIGAAIGAPLGGLLGREITKLYTAAISIPIMVATVRASTVAIGVIFALVVGALSALAPAMRAAKIAPAQAMRGLIPAGKGGATWIERLVPPLRRLPARWKVVLRGIGRNRNRTISTVVGVVLAVTLILTFWGMIDSTQVMLDRQFNQVNRQDAQLYLTTPVTPDVLARVKAVDGVAHAEPVADVSATIRTASEQYHTELLAFDPTTKLHGFVVGGKDVDLPSDGVFLGSSLKSQLDLHVGDEVTVEVPDLGINVTETVAGFVREPLGTYAYIAEPRLAELAGTSDVANTLYLTFDPGVDREAMRDQLSELPSVAAFIDSQALKSMVDQFMGLFYAFVGIMLALGGVMAFALIYNTISANVAERASEVAMMRAGGVARRTISRLLTAENVLLTLIGVIPGLIFGYAFAYYGVAMYSSDMFKWDLYIRPTTYVFTVLVILMAALLSQRPVLRAVQRIDVATVVRERSL